MHPSSSFQKNPQTYPRLKRVMSRRQEGSLSQVHLLQVIGAIFQLDLFASDLDKHLSEVWGEKVAFLKLHFWWLKESTSLEGPWLQEAHLGQWDDVTHPDIRVKSH